MKVLLAIGAVLAALSLTLSPARAGDDGVIRIGSYTAEVGDEVTVTLEAVDIPNPGLGAWTVDISFDLAILTAMGCEAHQNGVCDSAFREDTVRATGAHATGISGSFTLATFGFKCEAAGTTTLAVLQNIFTDGFPPPVLPGSEDGVITCTGPGSDGVIRIGSYTAVVGEEVTVVLEAVDIPPPGLGAWTVDVTYDTSVVSLIECDAKFGGICDPAHSENTLRVSGASAAGLAGTATLADIVFACGRAGATDLDVALSFGFAFMADDPPSFPDPGSGSLACTDLPAILPSAGAAKSDQGTLPSVAFLMVIGGVLLAAAFALRRYAPK